MRFVKCLTIALLATALSARADSIFNVNGTFTNSTTVSGTVTINTTTGVLDSGDLLYLGQHYNVLASAQLEPTEGGYVFFLTTSSGTFPLMDFDIQTNTLVGFTGAPLCSLDNLCPGTGPNTGVFFASAWEGSSDSVLFLQTGAVTAATPEPSSVALLATGLLGFAGVVRRRLR